MNWLKKVFSGEKKEEGDAEHFFFFICSGNASLINAYDNMFKQAAAADTKKTMILESPRITAQKMTLWQGGRRRLAKHH